MINPTAWPKDLLLSPEFIPIYKAVFCVTILNESSLSKLFSCTKFKPRDSSPSKDLSLCPKLIFSCPYIFATQCRRPYILQTEISGRSNNLSWKYQWFAPSSC